MKIQICMGSSCFARGNAEYLNIIEVFLDEHNLEDAVLLTGCTCKGSCSNGPNLTINGELHQGISAAQLKQLLNKSLTSRKEIMLNE